jgi:hypothetical protein
MSKYSPKIAIVRLILDLHTNYHINYLNGLEIILGYHEDVLR